MIIVEAANKVLSLGTIAAQVAIILAIVYLVFFRRMRLAVVDFIEQYSIPSAFLVVLISVCGSLFYSQIAGFPPCDLCWIQRVFMYPLFITLGIALFNKSSRLIMYSFISAIIGGLVSAYHNYMYYVDNGLNVFCQIGGIEVSCVKRYVFEFGYVTIPLMALTAFALIVILLLFYIRKENRGVIQ